MQPPPIANIYDEFEEDEDRNAIIDCDILEAAKENIQPLACGRRVTALARVLKTPHQIRNAKLEATRARFHERVKEAEARVDRLKLRASKKEEEEKVSGTTKNKGEDDGQDNGEDDDEEFTLEEAEEVLLDGYVRLVAWTIEHYPRGQSAQSGILELLEEATRAMRHSEYAKGDPRYLNLWIRYGTYVYHPEVIYAFLLANDIGTKWAKLYEEYAAILEKMNRRPKADEIFLLGIARKAEPLDHLEKRHREFQKRMMVAAPVLDFDTPNAEAEDMPAHSNPAPRRRALAESSSTSTAKPASTPLLSTSSTTDVFSIQSSSSSQALQSSHVRPRANGRIPVFIDPDGEFKTAANNHFPELGTRAERIKENRRMPEKMQGTILVQKGASKAALREARARARAAPKFTPYIEPEASEVPASNSNRKFEVFVDLEPSVPAGSGDDVGTNTATLSSSNRFEVFRDLDPESQDSSNGAKFVPFEDPDCEPDPPKIALSKDPVPSTGKPGKRKSKAVALKEARLAPRRSSRLKSKQAVATEPEPEPEPLPEGGKGDTGVKNVASTVTHFAPSQDEDFAEGRLPSAVSRTALRPKALGLGTSETEALKKNPFKNYNDL